MRIVLAAFAFLAAGSLFEPANADPYGWCAEYGGGRGGGRNCYFVTLQQCRAAISGIGGYCTPNQFYTGTPANNSRQRQERPVRWPYW